jgi:hypothetical protein
MMRLVTIILFVLVSVSRGQVQPLEDAPSVLRLISETRQANAIVHLRLILEPGAAIDPKHPDVRQQVIQNVLLVQTLKKTPDFLGDAALREACSAFYVGEKWPSSGALNYVDYLVLSKLPVGDFDHGGVSSSLHLVPVTEDVLRNVQRALRSDLNEQ